MSIIKSGKGSDQLLLDGFRYRRDRLVWRCVKHDCKGRVRYDDNTYKMYRDHICQALNTDEIEKAVFNYEVRKKAEQSHDPPRIIIQEARLKLSSDAAITIPQYSASARVVQRIRRDKNIPTEPKTFADIIIPHNFQNTVTNQTFVLYDNNDHHRRLLIFASKEQLDFLNSCESCHCDGTFAVAPNLFEQMYSIHGSVRGKSLPLVYSLLPNKNKETYEELFRIIKQYVARKPKYITIDFEKAAENAFGVLYPECDIFGCFFHFKQCIWRHICELHLKDEFLQNDISRRTMKNLAALAFVPPQHVIEEFVRMKESASDVLDGKKYPLFYYFIRYFYSKKTLRINRIREYIVRGNV
ncbi:unnamed protein product [Rotaria magnacalcarata]|uniref:MULE transposase domain-containing protein n=2 Tax=Rotaria magnacalcarata TaxID=392030 RepID=A0A816XT48_9BILA|nr:unnamed protein product [Rotaria magnacalcarata]CAF4127787.1 unnamed protein product [Rotaria magnacalcarata]